MQEHVHIVPINSCHNQRSVQFDTIDNDSIINDTSSSDSDASKHIVCVTLTLTYNYNQIMYDIT